MNEQLASGAGVILPLWLGSVLFLSEYSSFLVATSQAGVKTKPPLVEGKRVEVLEVRMVNACY